MTPPLTDNDTDLENLHTKLKINRTAQFKFYKSGNESSNLSDQEYEDRVAKGVSHCKRGMYFRSFYLESLNRNLKEMNLMYIEVCEVLIPSPYLFYFDYGNFKLFGSSPELQISVLENIAVISPIAGTVKRTGDVQNDFRLAREMKENPKEVSEHIMLVDLARNDLSRSAKNVQVEEYAETQYYSHVIHMVSKVSGELLEGKSSLDLYFDTFPAGTLSELQNIEPYKL